MSSSSSWVVPLGASRTAPSASRWAAAGTGCSVRAWPKASSSRRAACCWDCSWRAERSGRCETPPPARHVELTTSFWIVRCCWRRFSWASAWLSSTASSPRSGTSRHPAPATLRGPTAVKLVLSDDRLLDAPHASTFARRLTARVRGLPGVSQVGFASTVPPRQAPPIHIGFQRVSDNRDEFLMVSLGSVTPGYFPALGTRLLGGRFFDEQDQARDDGVVVLSESAARFFLPEADPVGRELGVSMRLPSREPSDRSICSFVDDAPGCRDRPYADSPGRVIGRISLRL